MSRNSGYSHQCVELDFQYSSEGVHRRWDEGMCQMWNAYVVPWARGLHVPCDARVAWRLDTP